MLDADIIGRNIANPVFIFENGQNKCIGIEIMRPTIVIIALQDGDKGFVSRFNKRRAIGVSNGIVVGRIVFTVDDGGCKSGKPCIG